MFSENVLAQGSQISFSKFQYINFEEGFAQFFAKKNTSNQDSTGADRININYEKFLFACFPKLFWPKDLKSVFGISECQF